MIHTTPPESGCKLGATDIDGKVAAVRFDSVGYLPGHGRPFLCPAVAPMPLRALVTPELLLEMDAAEVLIKWRGALLRPMTATHTDSGWRCRIIVEPTEAIPIVGTLPIELTECQRDILDTMRTAGHPMTKGQILAALEHGDKLHGESTVGYALANLRDRGLITSPGRGKRGGYSLTS